MMTARRRSRAVSTRQMNGWAAENAGAADRRLLSSEVIRKCSGYHVIMLRRLCNGNENRQAHSTTLPRRDIPSSPRQTAAVARHSTATFLLLARQL
jgi:hypothetical protein